MIRLRLSSDHLSARRLRLRKQRFKTPCGTFSADVGLLRMSGFGNMVSFNHDFLGREALLKEFKAGGPAHRLVGLTWNSHNVGELFAA
jgi:glycine cleavage system aminomethyltransferase T